MRNTLGFVPRQVIVAHAIGHVHRYAVEVHVWLLRRAAICIKGPLTAGQHLALAVLGVVEP